MEITKNLCNDATLTDPTSPFLSKRIVSQLQGHESLPHYLSEVDRLGYSAVLVCHVDRRISNDECTLRAPAPLPLWHRVPP